MTIRRFNYRKLPAILTVVAITLIQVVSTSVATTSASPSVALTDADLIAEGRTLDSFATDLEGFEKKSAELGKKASLTRVEFDSHERTANDLKRRLFGVQNAVRDVIRKLKAAGQWDNLDQVLLTKINDTKFQNFIRAEGGFKKLLDEAASGLSNGANEISTPLDVLRNRVQGAVFGPGPAFHTSQAIRVVYTPRPAMLLVGLSCRVGMIQKVIRLNHGNQSDPSFMRFCFDRDRSAT